MTEIIGSGLAFPLQVDRRGGIALARDETDIEQAIELILATAPGERATRITQPCGVASVRRGTHATARTLSRRSTSGGRWRLPGALRIT